MFVGHSRNVLEVVAPGGFTRQDNNLHVTRRQLLRFADVRRFVAGQGLSQVADAMMTVTLAHHLLFMKSDGPTVSRLMQTVVAALVPLVVAGPLAGVIADRVSRRGILAGGQAARVVIALSMACVIAAGGQTPLLMLWGVSLCLNRVMYTARSVSVRHIVRQHELVAMDSLLLTVGGVAGAIGGSLGVGGMSLFGTATVLGAAALHAVSGIRYVRVRAHLGGGTDHTIAEWSDAKGKLLEAKFVYAIASTSAHRLLSGAMFSIVLLVIDARMSGSASGYALAAGACGTGTLLGSTTAEWFNERFPRRSMAVLAYSLSAVALCAALVVDTRNAFMAGLFACAFLFQNLRVCTDATIQKNAARGAGGRTFAIYDLSYNMAYLAGVLAGLGLTYATSYFSILTMVAVAYALCAVVFALMRRETAVADDSAPVTIEDDPASRGAAIAGL
jgi:MFS family permease